MSNPSTMYVLKYNMKYALASDDMSEAEKQQIRQVERVSRNISRAFWVYAPLDVALTLVWHRSSLKETHGAGSVQAALGKEAHRGRLPLLTLFLAVRLAGMYHLSTTMSQKYLADNVTMILRQKNPMKEQLLEKMQGL